MSTPDSSAFRESLLSRRAWLGTTAAGTLSAALPRFLRAEGRGDVLVPSDVEKDLVWHTKDVPNAEPALGKIVGDWQTPLEHFYVRSHAPAPKVDLGSFRLTIEGLVERPLSLSVDDLRSMSQETVVATMTCAGNRRNEHNAVKPVEGVQWQAGAIGNTAWTGVPLAALLKKAGIRDGAKHVWFEGLDEIEKGGRTIGFGASIPIEKALADHNGIPGALVTWMMAGKPLAPDHGFPVRTVVPGYIGARSVKWLGRIVVSAEPSSNHYLATAYKLVQRTTALDWAEAGPIYNFPINSVITSVRQMAMQGTVEVTGYAYPPGDGRSIEKVELSADGGRTWTAAKITSDRKPFCWVLWDARLKVPGDAKSLIVRAVDSAGLVQPRTVPWNAKGYMYNAWHEVALNG